MREVMLLGKRISGKAGLIRTTAVHYTTMTSEDAKAQRDEMFAVAQCLREKQRPVQQGD